MRQDEIHAAIRIVKREIRQWEEPVVGVVARMSARDPFRILISFLLSLRTKDKTTGEASARLFALAHTPAGLLQLSLKKIERAIYPVGFYRTKAKSIHAICRRLLDVYGGRVPDSIDELITLSGVGRKTANLVVTVGYGKPGICVDIHVHRISNRWGYVRTKTPEELSRPYAGSCQDPIGLPSTTCSFPMDRTCVSLSHPSVADASWRNTVTVSG